MTSHHDRQEAKRQEALRALERARAESETVGDSLLAKMAKQAQNHLGAADKDPDDPVEVWGSRIGRVAGVIFALGLIVYLARTYIFQG